MKSSQRFLAIDVLRGMTICFMIIVNTPGNGATSWAPLHHASWNGFTPTDLVFPTFMFVVGNALVYSMKKWEGLSDSKVIMGIVKRAFLIFLLGYLMYWFPFVHWQDNSLVGNPIGHTRIMGVLQRIALGYLCGALMIRYLKPSTVYRLSVIFLLLYWLILLLFGETGDPYNMMTNAGTKLDMFLFGENHLYHGEGVPFDPEGLLSTLPAIANVTFGYAAGKWLLEKGKTYEGLTKLLLVGVIAIAIALCWNPFFPINKKLWTGSFVLLTVGIDCVLLAALVYVTDFLQRTKWTSFFQVFGKNPLFIYLLSELGATMLWFIRVGENHEPLHLWAYQNIFSHAGPYLGSFLFALCFMLCCWAVGYFLDRKKIYVRV
ncbi:MAG: heparan-alpha-glucosaminide N-acetyltransferase domain-containing protein [Chitinophagaceae bacterium]